MSEYNGSVDRRPRCGKCEHPIDETLSPARIVTNDAGVEVVVCYHWSCEPDD